jgi:hypothetical protein
MADLFFPQLRTGAIAHYPIRKTATTRTVLNVLPEGSILTYPDDAARKVIWSWDYVGLTTEEARTVQNFFVACTGPLRPFTFLDPTGNLLSASSNFTADPWQSSSELKFSTTSAGPVSPGVPAMTVVNNSQIVQELKQSLDVPSNYSYCFSLYLTSPTPDSVTLFRRSENVEHTLSVQIGPDWKRVSTAGNLQDPSEGFSIGIRFAPGQQIALSAAQLQPQPGLSPYLNKAQAGDVYPNSHWAIDELSIRYLGPNDCTVSVAVES